MGVVFEEDGVGEGVGSEGGTDVESALVSAAKRMMLDLILTITLAASVQSLLPVPRDHIVLLYKSEVSAPNTELQ